MRFNPRNMFESARIKLTFWYVIIALTVSSTFSLIIYKEITLELEKQFHTIEQQFRLGSYGDVGKLEPDPFFEKDLKTVKESLVFSLIYLNGFVFLFATIAGSLSATKTLKPIENTLENQKRFVVDASHELKTPVTVLKTSIEVALRNKNLKLSGAVAVLKDCLEEIDNLHKLIANMLSLAQFHDRDTNFKVVKFETSDLTAGVVGKFNSVAKIAGISIETNLVRLKIKAVKEDCEKLITILIDNALKYSNKGGKIKVISSKSGKYFKLLISDTGIGISKRDLPRLFDRFYRVDASRNKTNIDGFGLGLSLAKKIVDNHEGKLTFNSKVGQGTTVTVKLPIKPSVKILS